jgi:hypothetical protein
MCRNRSTVLAKAGMVAQKGHCGLTMAYLTLACCKDQMCIALRNSPSASVGKGNGWCSGLRDSGPSKVGVCPVRRQV